MKNLSSAFAFAALALGMAMCPAPASAAKTQKQKPFKVESYVTSTDGSNLMKHSAITPGKSKVKAESSITLNPGDVRQGIDGFGFAITGSAAYNLLKMKPAERKALLTRIFSPKEGYGCSYVRVPIGCSDFSLSDYTCNDTPGLENFALTGEETDYIIPVMKEILAINPDVKVMSAPWTAPRWMKTTDTWTSGELSKDHYQDYAKYFVKWIKAFADKGVEIYAVTPQNEPLNRGNSASMFMGWDEARDFVKDALGPEFEKNGVKTKIYVFDHNYNYDNMPDQQGYPTKIYADPEASKYIAGAAYHNYGGRAEEMSRVHDANPDKELIFTEWTAGTWSRPGVGIEAICPDAKALIFDVVKNHGQGSIVWNLMLDSERGPYRPGGCSTGNGAIDIDTKDYSSMTYNSFYYVICTAASAVSQGAHRIGATDSNAGVDYVAFKNGDGTYGLVLMNTQDTPRTVSVSEGSRTFDATVPAKSIASYRW